MTKIQVVRQILEWNQDTSDTIREELKRAHVYMINVMGSPGAGKTSLIAELIRRLPYRCGVIEGDIAGQVDAERMAKEGVPVVQLNTDGACHIEAMSIQHILPSFDLEAIDVMFIENIGNLVCPAEFDLGEALRIAVLSIPEGDDKPEKYPLLFSRAHILALSKYDMLPYFDFDEQRAVSRCTAMNPDVSVIGVSVRTGEGINALTCALEARISEALQ